MPKAVDSTENRALVLTSPDGDGTLVLRMLGDAGIAALACPEMADVAEGVGNGASVVVLPIERLEGDDLTLLEAIVETQPPWSDFAILVSIDADRTKKCEKAIARLRRVLGNVTFHERPLQAVSLVSVVLQALRARRRQYDMRDLLAKHQEEHRQRDHFLAMLGHELRNPLAGIIMAGDIMDRSPLDTFAKQRGLISRQARHLAQLVDDLLDVSRVTTGKITLRRTAVDLLEVARRGLVAAEVSLQTHHLDAAVTEDSQRVLVDGDPVRIEQIAGNLLANAVRFTPSGGRISLRVANEGGEGVLRVRDTGHGIPPHMLDRVFELFTQAETTLDRAQGGLGIGLTVVRGLVELHGGRVEAVSEGEGRGTEVIVRLPLYNGAPSVPPPPEEVRASSRQHVVIIEDHGDYRELLQATLEELGHHVEAAVDGLSGLALLLSVHPDIALIDIGLPGLDGYALARQARAAFGRSIFLVALTGYGQPEDLQRAREAGFDLHLTKPIDIKALQRMLASASANPTAP